MLPSCKEVFSEIETISDCFLNKWVARYNKLKTEGLNIVPCGTPTLTFKPSQWTVFIELVAVCQSYNITLIRT